MAAIRSTPWRREVSAHRPAVQDDEGRWVLAEATSARPQRWVGSAPPTADGAYRVAQTHDGAEDAWLTIEPQGREAQRGKASGNVVVYPQATGDQNQDVAVALLPNKLEEFVIAHAVPDEPLQLVYVLSHGAGVHLAPEGPNGSELELVDRLGRRFVTLPPAWAVDATGELRLLEVEVAEVTDASKGLGTEGGGGGARPAGKLRLTLSLDPSGLQAPIVIDPAWTFGAGFPAETIMAFSSFECLECADVFGDVAVVGGSGSATVGTLDESNIRGDLSASTINLGADGWLRANAYASPGGYNITPGGLINQPYTTSFPLVHSVPTLPSFVAGDEDAQPGELNPGSYRDVIVQEDDGYFFNGVFNLRSLELAEGAVLACDDFCEVRVKESVLIGPSARLSGAFVIYIEGGDVGSTSAFESLTGAKVDAMVAAPNGTIKLAAEQEHEGHFVADEVIVGSDAVVNGAMPAPMDYDCAAFCTKQDALACGATPWSSHAACVAACDAAMVEPDCVTFKRSLVDCWNRSSGAAYCDGNDLPAKTYCDDEQQHYDNCVSICSQKDDENECTEDTCSCLPSDCEVENAISHSNVPNGTDCGENGDACNGVFTCMSGSCELTTEPINPDDSNPCTADSCLNGVVTNAPLPAGTACGAGTNLCDGMDYCDGTGTCIVVDPVDPDDSNPCTADSCQDGVAINSALALGTSCDTDNNACNGIDRCDGVGACVPAGAPLPSEALDDGNPCTADACNATTGQVEHVAVADGTSCSDGDACNGLETCQAGTCAQGAPAVLDDADPTTIDVCHDDGGTATVLHVTPPTEEELRATMAPAAPMFSLSRFMVDAGIQVPVGETKAQLLAKLDAEPRRVAVITGRVLDDTGNPVANANVHVKTYEDPTREYGITRTLAAGTFKLVVLGEERPLLLELSKPGYLEVHRRVLALPGTTAALDNDVVLTETGSRMVRPTALPPLSPSLPHVVLGPSSPMQVVEGELEDDVAPTAPPGATRARRPILIFKPGTQAEVVTYATDTTPEVRTPTSTLKLREREFTTGSNGPLAMPGPLPTTSAYTYALEFTADEVEAAGADTVEFTNQPVIMYVDDFWGFEPGSIVPLGYYNRHLARWEAEEDGLSLQVLQEAGDVAQLSLDGVAELTTAQYQQLGVDEEELRVVATLYDPGKVLWRIPIHHFSPLDPNGFPRKGDNQCVPDDDDCDVPDPIADNGEADPNCTGGSIIECQNRTLRQTVPVPGTPFTLNYRSDRTPAFKRPYRVKAYLSGNDPPEAALAMRAQLLIAGELADEHVVTCPGPSPCPANLAHTFDWNGESPWGSAVGAPVRATVRISYRYATPPPPTLTNVVVGSGGGLGGGSGSGGAIGSSFGIWPVRDDVTLDYVDPVQAATEPPREFWVSRSYQMTLGSLDARTAGFGGWTLSERHVYVPGARALYRGDGSLVYSDVAEPVSEEHSPSDPVLFDPWALALSSSGRWLYIADRAHCIRRMDTRDDSFEAIAGSCGTSGFAGDGQSALSARFNTPQGIAVASNGDIFISDTGNHCIRRIDANTGVITTVAGTPTATSPNDPQTQQPLVDHVATAATMHLRNPRGIAVADSGTLYIADHGHRRVVGVYSNALAKTVAGDGEMPALFGEPARAPTLLQPADALNVVLLNVYDVDVLPNGDLLVADGGHNSSNHSSWVLRVRNESSVELFLGNGSKSLNDSSFGIGGEGPYATLVVPRAVSSDIRGNVYVTVADVREGSLTNPGVWTAAGVSAKVLVGGRGLVNRSFRTGVGEVAQALGLYSPRDLAISSDGAMYIADKDYDGVIIKIDATFPTHRWADYEVPSTDGREVYRFDSLGRHYQTIDTATGTRLYSFSAWPNNPLDTRLYGVTDADGRHTDIVHSLGETQIVGPFGHTTKVKRVGSSWTTEIEDPLQRVTSINYALSPTLGSTGLMSSFKTPGQTVAKTYTFDLEGFLEDAETPGSLTKKTFATSELNGVETTTMTTALGLQTTYDIEQTSPEVQTRTVTGPDGTATVTTRGEDGSRTLTRPDTSSVTMTTSAATAGRLKMATPKRTTVYKTRATGGKTLTIVTDEEAVEAIEDGDPLTFDALTTTSQAWVGSSTAGPPDRQSTAVFDLDGSTCGLSAQRCVQTTTPAGRVLERVVDEKGRVLLEIAPSGAIALADVEYTYYDTGLLEGYLKEVIAAPGTPEERKYLFEYDASGRLEKVTNPLNQVTQYGYDAADQLLTSTLPSTEVIGFGYTGDGQLTMVDPPGSGTSNQHTMGYDRFMLMDAYTTPAVGSLPRDTSYTFDDDRRLDDITMPSGDIIDWQYNGLGQVDFVDVPVSPPGDLLGDDIDPTYVASGDHQGKLQHITAGGTTVAYGYDGSLVTSTTLSLTSPAVSHTVSWTHDDFLRTASEKVGTGPQIDFSYDDDDLLTGAHVTGQPADGVVMTRDPDTGLLTEVRSGTGTNELVTSYSYNTFGEVTLMRTDRSTSPTPTLIYEVAYDRDLLGRVEYKTETTSGGVESWGYTYDLEGRLVEVTHGTGQSCKDGVPACAPIEAYGYDANGNRTHEGTSLGSLSLIGTYDHRDRIVTYDGESYVYDDNGMLKQKGSGASATHYDYDLFGNLRKVTLPSGATITYTIDGLGRRVGRTYDDGINPPDTRYWVYRDQLNPVAELDAAGNLTKQFVYAEGAHVPSFMIAGGITYRFITDQLGSVRLVVRTDDGSVAQRIDYDAWGGATLVTGAWGLQPFGFAGGLDDADTELYRFGARDYDPRDGRWTMKDPILFRGGQTNLYEYVGGAPTNGVDPSGTFIQAPCGGFAGDRAVAWLDKQAQWAYRFAAEAYEDDNWAGTIAFAAMGALAEAAPTAADVALTVGGAVTAKLGPHPKAQGPHTSFKWGTGPKGPRINGYETYNANGNPILRFRGTGRPHGGVDPPLVITPRPGKGPGSPPRVPRKPSPGELPRGY